VAKPFYLCKKKTMLSKLFLGLLLMCSLLNVQDIDTLNAPKDAQSLYDISLTDISGAPLDLSQYKGKKILFVNVASKCGFTSQYDGLQELYKTYKDKLVVIGLPCNQFGGQEPGTAKEIESFCRANYGVDFPLSSKIEVKGASQHPIYKWLTSKSQNGVMDSTVRWNFQKYLVDENGQLIDYFYSTTKPMSSKIIKLL
jgi:glutathione peroxidase